MKKKAKSAKSAKNKRNIYDFKKMEDFLTSLSELAKNEEEQEELIKRLNISILPTGNEQYVCEAVFCQTDDNEQIVEEVNNGKWRFMIMAKTAVKEQPRVLHKISTKYLNVDDIDAALVEIRERLNCKVYKLYSDGIENYIVEGDCFAGCPSTFQRVGWAVLPYELYSEKKEATND